MNNKALLIGINYRNTPSELRGCINDVIGMKSYLLNNNGYTDSNIKVLTEDLGVDNKSLLPTRDIIMKNLYDLVINTHKEKIDNLFIHYSGHGTYVNDTSGDELDKKDEAICPLDYDKSGIITDDIIHHVLESVNPKTSVIVVMDCCHSGSILDLRYTYQANNKNKLENKKSKIRSNIIMISGCKDTQTSADAWNVSGTNKSEGALTANILKILSEYKYDITCYKLLNELQKNMVKQGFDQIPQLTCSQPLSQTSIFSYNKSLPMTSYMKFNVSNLGKKRKLEVDTNLEVDTYLNLDTNLNLAADTNLNLDTYFNLDLEMELSEKIGC